MQKRDACLEIRLLKFLKLLFLPSKVEGEKGGKKPINLSLDAGRGGGKKASFFAVLLRKRGERERGVFHPSLFPDNLSPFPRPSNLMGLSPSSPSPSSPAHHAYSKTTKADEEEGRGG